jgi:hypothetical protein
LLYRGYIQALLYIHITTGWGILHGWILHALLCTLFIFLPT